MLSVHEVNRFMDGKRRDKFVTFEKIFQQCQKLIMKHAENDRYRCFFTVPEFMLGLPVYNLNAAIIYIVEKITAKGFLVKYFHPNVLYICWDIDEIHGRKKTVEHMVASKPLPVPPRLKMMGQKPMFPPMPEQTRVTNKPDQGGIIMSHTPKYDLPMPQSSSFGRPQQNKNFIKSISDYRPSGKFVLDV
jgi:Family of unknown function (DUF5759)